MPILYDFLVKIRQVFNQDVVREADGTSTRRVVALHDSATFVTLSRLVIFLEEQLEFVAFLIFEGRYLAFDSIEGFANLLSGEQSLI